MLLMHYASVIPKNSANKKLLSEIRKNGLYEIYSNKDYIILNLFVNDKILSFNMLGCFDARKDAGCTHGWRINKDAKVGSGAFGTTYLACCDRDCNYIAKHVILKTDEDIKLGIKERVEEKFETEVSLQKLATSNDLAPKVYSHWSCVHGGIIIMEPMRMTLNTFFENSNGEFVLIMTKKFLEKYTKLKKLGINHGDLHLDNIMLTYIDKSDISSGMFDMKFIDFGQASMGKSHYELISTCRSYLYYVRKLLSEFGSSELRFFFSYSLLMIVNSFPLLKSIIETESIPDMFIKKFGLEKNPSITSDYKLSDDEWVQKIFMKNAQELSEETEKTEEIEEEIEILKKMREERLKKNK